MSFVASRLFRTCLPAAQRVVQRRGMAGGDPKMAVKKNKFMEEWNGRREITTQSFEMNFKDVPKFIIWIVLFPYSIYTTTRAEFLASGERRYKDLI